MDPARRSSIPQRLLRAGCTVKNGAFQTKIGEDFVRCAFEARSSFCRQLITNLFMAIPSPSSAFSGLHGSGRQVAERGVFALVLIAGLGLADAAESKVSFNRDIRPIFSDNCTACHGPDAKARKADLRLDTKEGFFEKTAKRGPAVVARNLEKSELWQRVITTDPDDIMPPPDSHKSLKPEQKEKLKQWILAGAPWEGHWSVVKPEKPNVPVAKASGFKCAVVC